MALLTGPLLLATVPVVGALLGLALWGRPEVLKVWLLLVTLAALGSIGWTARTLPVQAAPLPLLSLLPLVAFVCLLGQPAHRHSPLPWLATLLLLGLGLGVLACEASLSAVCFSLALAFVCLMLVRSQPETGSVAWGGAGTLALGMLAALVSIATTPPLSTVAFAFACAVALPLVPLHKGYVAALTSLPGNLSAFLAFMLPVTGFHALLTAFPQLPHPVPDAVGFLALGGSIYGSLRAFTQSRTASVVAYGSLSFLSALWWYLVATRTAPPQTVVYLSAVGLAASGLLLSWHVLRVRYGEIGFRALSGLAEPMPRFAIILSLLVLAALGLPPFGVFSGFIGMLLAPALTWSFGLMLILIAWLSASWYLFDLVQSLLFGRRRPEYRQQDLRGSEFVSLAIVLVLLAALGVMPPRRFDPGLAPFQRTVVTGVSAWNK